MRLDVGEAHATFGGDGSQRRHLVAHELAHLLGRQVHRAAAAMRRVGVARMRADVEAVRRGDRDQAAHRAAVAGMHAAGDVHRRHQVEQRQLDQFVKRRRRLADVGVQIDVHRRKSPGLEQKSDGKKKRAPR